MNDQQFLLCACKLKNISGLDLGTIGMEAETQSVAINIYGDYSDNYALNHDVSFKYKKHWHDSHLSESQIKVLEIILEKEVEHVQEQAKLESEIRNEQEQYEKDTERYGRPDVIYKGQY